MKKFLLKIVAVFVAIVAIFSLVGCTELSAPSAYQIALENGFVGTEAEWLESLKCKHPDGKSAYEIALENGFVGSEEDWIASLKGLDGDDGKDLDINDMYAAAKADGYTGSMSDFLKEFFDVEVGTNTDTTLVADNLLSTVSLYCVFTELDGSTFFSSATGVIYHLEKENGRAFIITNYHAVHQENTVKADDTFDKAFVYLYGAKNGLSSTTLTDETGSPMMARFVGGSPENDIAVIAVENSEVLKNSAARQVRVRDDYSSPVRMGEKVRVVGNAGGKGIAVTEGVIVKDNEYINLTSLIDSTQAASHRVMRTDAIINKGNSGGGLFDADGKLLGIVNAKSTNVNLEDMGYAIPIGKACRIADEAIQKGYVDKGLLGVQLYVQSSTAKVDDKGDVFIVETIIVDIPATTPASSAYGVFEVGDIVKEIRTDKESMQVTRLHDVGDFLISVEAGETVTIVIERGGVEMEKQITLSESHMKRI